MIIVENYSGIGNIMKNLVSALRRADIENDMVSLHTTYAANYVFSFEQDVRQAKDEVEHSCTWQLQLHKNDTDVLKENKSIIVMDNPEDYWIHNNVIDMQYHNISDHIIQDFVKYFKKLKFDKGILQYVDSFVQNNDIENCVGVHLRSWSDHAGRKNLLHNTAMFVEIMEKFPNDKFFISTDDDSVLKEVKDIFGSRIITREFKEDKNTYYNSSTDAVVNCITDMLITSKCKQLIGTYQSTFSECIWWLSGAKPIIVPKPMAISNFEQKLYTQL